jgi:deoxyribodipyrimidine photo-lyase
MRAWKATHLTGQVNLIDPPSKITTPSGISSDPGQVIPDEVVEMDFLGGEQEAQRRLDAFTRGTNPEIYRYADQRDRMDLDATSLLSPYLRFGMLSAGQAVQAAREALQNARDESARKGAETWLNELIWREFYIAILYHFPRVSRGSFRENLRDIRWNNDPREFDAWCEGRTGYPVVDAAMRQLRNTGWMHNRARMIVASFLTKDLLIDWRWGERWFMQQLVDGDPAANNGGWQWTAGTGTDAAPYFRIFNPVLQSKKFDPHGDYIRRWVSELVQVPGRYIHSPWEMPVELQRNSKCLLGEDYPLPIIDHRFARQRTLEAYKNAGQEVD